MLQPDVTYQRVGKLCTRDQDNMAALSEIVVN